MNKQSGTVAILMATRNGAAYLKQQLDSFEKQNYRQWSLWASDDGSTDSTNALIRSFAGITGNESHLVNGPQTGPSDNFMSLVTRPQIQARYYAFADQDDIWLSDKLSRAVEWLETIEDNVPALYCSRTRLIDEHDRPIGYSPLYARNPCFGNALLQNIASGNTMIFNQRARELLLSVRMEKLVIHDWTLYQVVTGCGGEVKYDPEPTVLYRQHGNNAIGNSMEPMQRLRNFLYACNGRAANWNDVNRKVLARIAEDLTPQAKDMLAAFCAIRNNSLLKRLSLMRKSGIYHQQLLGSFSTFAYVLLDKF